MTYRLFHTVILSLLALPSAFAIDPFYEGTSGIREMVFETNCTACHSVERSGAQRNGAPEGLNWDVYESARANGDRIITRAAIQMTMPPPSSGIPPLNTEQRNALLAWQAAGFPQAGQPTPQNPSFSFSDLMLRLPVVQVGAQYYNATLEMVRQLPGSPTGFGFVLRAATLTQPNSANLAVFDMASGLVSIPLVELVEGGIVTRSVSAEMSYVPGSNPRLFLVNSVTTVAP